MAISMKTRRFPEPALTSTPPRLRGLCDFDRAGSSGWCGSSGEASRVVLQGSSAAGGSPGYVSSRVGRWRYQGRYATAGLPFDKLTTSRPGLVVVVGLMSGGE